MYKAYLGIVVTAAACSWVSAAALPSPGDQLIQANTAWVTSATDNRDTTTNNYNGGTFKTASPLSPFESIAVTHVGYVDQGADGLLVSHSVAVWKDANNKVLDVTVPQGTAAPLQGGFRWMELTTPILLEKNTSYTLGGQTNGDQWKEAAATGNDTYSFAALSAVLPYGTPADNYDPWHRWGGSATDMPSGSAGWGWNRHYIAGNLAFAVVPEPTSIAGLAALSLLARRRRA